MTEQEWIAQQVQLALAGLRARGVKTLVLFGPAARGEAPPGGEVDFLLELHPPLTCERYRAVREYLSALLERPVELVMESPHHPLIWPHIQEEALFLL
jgi:uncharacterized protein